MAAVLENHDFLEAVTRTVASMIKMPAERLEADARFESLGIDSIVGMEIIARLSKEFSVPITPAQFAEVSTIRELAVQIEATAGRTGRAGRAEVAPRRAPPPVSAAPKFERRPVANPPETSRHSGRMQDTELDGSLRTYIRRKYSIDTDDRRFGSVSEVVDYLVSNHYQELRRYYGYSTESAKDTAEPQRLDADARPAENSDQKNAHDIAIVGISCLFPDAPTHSVFWANLMERKSSIRDIPGSRWRWEDCYAQSISPGKTISRWGALLDDIDCFDADFFKVSPEEAKGMDPQERLLCQEVYKAIQDAGINIETLAGSDTGVFVGYEYAEYEQQLRAHADRLPGRMRYSSASPTYYLANRISYAFDLCGPSEAINVNCAASAVAINRAYYSLANRECSLAVAAGVSLNLFAGDYIAETQYGLLSPDGTCGVFDNDANGFTRGEGVGVLVLKRLDDAIRDRNTIYGIIKSCHQRNRGRANSLSDIKHEAITSVIEECYRKVAVSPESVSYIELDGYATKWGDSFEFEGTKNVFSDSNVAGKYCALGSLKGNIGNLEPASGIASVIKVALALRNKQFPATITKKTTSEFIDLEDPKHPLYFADSRIPFESIRRGSAPIRAGVSSFSDSGCNMHILLEEYLPDDDLAFEEDPSARYLFVFSAQNRVRLDEYLREFVDHLSQRASDLPLASVAYTLQVGREAMRHRLAICASSKAELFTKIAAFQTDGAQPADLQAKGTWYRDSQTAASDPLAGAITFDMIAGVIDRCRTDAQWQQIALLWVNGIDIPWERVWEGMRVMRVPLTTYQFAKDRYWFDTGMLLKSGDEHVAGNRIEPVLNPLLPMRKPDAASASVDGTLIPSTAAKLELLLQQELALQLQKPISALTDGRSYLELGVTSLDVISLVRKINGLFDLRLSPSAILKYPDIRRLAMHLAENHAEKIESFFGSTREHSSPPFEHAAGYENEYETAILPSREHETRRALPREDIDEKWVVEQVRWAGPSADQVLDYEKVTF